MSGVDVIDGLGLLLGLDEIVVLLLLLFVILLLVFIQQLFDPEFIMTDPDALASD